jgi:hypothetical protein
LIISDISIKLDTDLLHFEWKWDAISSDGLDSNTISPQLALLKENGLFRPTLSDLHELKLHQKQGLHWWTTLANFKRERRHDDPLLRRDDLPGISFPSFPAIPKGPSCSD